MLVFEDFPHWSLAKVIRLIPEKNGKIRTLELKTRAGAMLRPFQRVYPMEVQSKENPDDPLNNCSFTNLISPISSDVCQILTTPLAPYLEYPGMDGSSSLYSYKDLHSYRAVVFKLCSTEPWGSTNDNEIIYQKLICAQNGFMFSVKGIGEFRQCRIPESNQHKEKKLDA
ncbi:hypothetical protein TNCT_187011 [Trichonephila clavata]|uniref:Uncharacterized protein n=1 Tax=Trichonephila clavata TaxID=2740835 RepID=A0A8X6G0R8_TRICU|nr:hypothetical protein TNCT_187011 [Trichonephila clavata]